MALNDFNLITFSGRADAGNITGIDNLKAGDTFKSNIIKLASGENYTDYFNTTISSDSTIEQTYNYSLEGCLMIALVGRFSLL